MGTDSDQDGGNHAASNGGGTDAGEWPVETFIGRRPYFYVVITIGCTILFGGTALGYFEMDPFLGFINARVAASFLFVLFFVTSVIMVLGLFGPMARLSVGAIGVRLSTYSGDWVPWTAITAIEEDNVDPTSSDKGRMIRLRIDPAVEKTLDMTKVSRTSQKLGRKVGTDGMWISPKQVGAEYGDVLGALERGQARARGEKVEFPPGAVEAARSRVPKWLKLTLVCVAEGWVLAAVIAYGMEVMPSADGPHPFSWFAVIGISIGFTLLTAPLIGAFVWSLGNRDNDATPWELLVTVPAFLAAGIGSLVAADSLGFSDDGEHMIFFFVSAVTAYWLVRWAYRRKWPPARSKQGE